MFDFTRGMGTVDAAHFFSRVLQIGRQADVAECRAALVERFRGPVSRAQSRLIEPAKAFAEPTLGGEEGAREVTPQLERVAGLLLDVGEDLPSLRLASLLSVSWERESRGDPWFITRSIDEASKVSYIRRLYNDAGSDGSLIALARTFLVDPSQLAARLAQFVAPLTNEADGDCAYVEGRVGSNGQVEIEAYWDGFVSIDLRVADAEEFARVSRDLLEAVASLVPRSVLNLGDALIEAVARESSATSS